MRKTGSVPVFLASALLLAGAPAGAEDGVRWQSPVEIAAGKGTKGPWRQNESGYDYVDDGTAAFSPRGELAALWVNQAAKDVFFRHPDGTVVNVSRSPETYSWLPRVVYAPQDAKRVHVLWQEIIFSGGSHGGDILFATSADGGKSFSPPRNLSRSQGGDGKGRIDRKTWDNGSLDLAAGADGAVYAAWTDYEGRLYLSVSADAGGTFSSPRRIAGSDRYPARGPSIAIGPDRTLYLAWTHGEDRGADIFVSRSTDGGATFSPGRVIVDTPPYSDAPKLAVDARGTVHVAFADGDRILYSRSGDGGRSFGSPRALSDSPAGFPSIAVDPHGNVVVLWERLRDGRPHGLGFAHSRDAGRSFAAPTVVPGSEPEPGAWNGSQQGLLAKKLALGADGAIAAVNSSLAPGARSRVWLIRGTL